MVIERHFLHTKCTCTQYLPGTRRYLPEITGNYRKHEKNNLSPPGTAYGIGNPGIMCAQDAINGY